MARLYQEMCEQDVDDGSMNRREMQFLSANQCVERLAMLETHACELKLREEQVQSQSQELNLLDNEAICDLMGYRFPMDTLSQEYLRNME